MHLNKIFHWPQLNKAIFTKITLRSAGTFKRPQLRIKVDQLADVKATYFKNRTDLTSKEWQNLTDLLINNYKHISRQNVDAIIVGVCSESQQLLLAKSYINHLKNSGIEPNNATLGKLLRIYNSVYHSKGGRADSLTKQEQNEILEIYGNIRSKHDVLDSTSCENLIYGLVATSKWKEALELMEMMKLTTMPTAGASTEMVIKAFRMQEMTMGWSVLEQMLEQRKLPKCEIFLTYLNTLTDNLKSLPGEFEKFLTFLQTYDIVITEKIVKAIIEISAEYSKLLSVTSTKLERFGKCSCCGLHLENVTLTDEDFQKLTDSFLDKVLIRNDVFQKSTPEEVIRFREYVERTGPYDCVIDGLNVAYSMGSKKPPQAFANLLAAVVKYFKNKNQHVLVLGRRHMNNWPKKSMQYVKENSAMFLANDLSQDDPFMLYATLKSGQATDFFSRDLMRQHAFMLGPDLKGIFRRWQQEHQYSLITQTDSGKIIIKEPIRHLICAHKVGDTWHVPYKREYTQHVSDSFDIPEHWLCIKLGHPQIN